MGNYVRHYRELNEKTRYSRASVKPSFTERRRSRKSPATELMIFFIACLELRTNSLAISLFLLAVLFSLWEDRGLRSSRIERQAESDFAVTR